MPEVAIELLKCEAFGITLCSKEEFERAAPSCSGLLSAADWC